MRSMNGAASGSADSRGYPPAGLPLPPGLVPGLGGAAGPTPGLPPASASLAGLGFGGAGSVSGSVVGGAGAAGASGGSSGPAELKHHADFLSRLLAATPSYMSEIGNPPPGFFSDWLRRLVSKPSGNSGSSALHGNPAGAGLTFPAGGGSGGNTMGSSSGSVVVPSNNSNPSLGGASSLGQPETEGSIVGGRTGAQSSRDNVNSAASQLDAHIPSKRRKRSRLNDQLPLGDKDSERHSPAGRPPSTTMASATSPLSSGGAGGGATAGSSSTSSPAAAAGFHPFGPHPFWFFPPFLPNPYMNSVAAAAAAMSMNMGVPFPPGLAPNQPLGSNSASGGATSGASAGGSTSGSTGPFLGGAQSPSELFRTDNLNLLSGSITSATTPSNGRMSGSAGSSPHTLSSINPFVTPSLEGVAHLPSHLSKLGSSRTPGESSSPLSQKETKDMLANSPPLKDVAYFSAAAAASASLLLNTSKYEGSSQSHSSPTKINNQTPSPHYINGLGHKISNKSPPAHHLSGSSSSSKGGGNSTNKSSSFSISRLTSPSPSNSGIGGGGGGSSSSRHYHHHHQHHHQLSHSAHASGGSHNNLSNPGSYGEKLNAAVGSGVSGSENQSRKEGLLLNSSLTKLSSPASATKSGYGTGNNNSSSSNNNNTNAGNNSSSSSDSGLCVDLRVSGRIWESSSTGSSSSSTAASSVAGGGQAGNTSSGRAATPPRPIYTALSAFRDPADVNLFGSSQSSPQVPRYDHHHSHSSLNSRYSPAGLAGYASSLPIPPLNLQGKTGAPSYQFPTDVLTPPSEKIASNSTLSTRYVLGNLQKIYQKIRPLCNTNSSAPFKESSSSSLTGSITGQKNNSNNGNRSSPPTSESTRKRRRSSSSSSNGKSNSPTMPANNLVQAQGNGNGAKSQQQQPIISNHHSPKSDKNKMDSIENKNTSVSDGGGSGSNTTTSTTTTTTSTSTMINLNPNKKAANKSHNKSTKKTSRKTSSDSNNGNLSSSDHDEPLLPPPAPVDDMLVGTGNKKTTLSSSSSSLSSSSSSSSSDDENNSNVLVDDEQQQSHQQQQYFKNEPEDLKIPSVNGESNFSLSLSLNNNNVEGGKGMSPGKNNNKEQQPMQYNMDSISSSPKSIVGAGQVKSDYEEMNASPITSKLQRRSSFDNLNDGGLIDLEVPKNPLNKGEKKKSRGSHHRGSGSGESTATAAKGSSRDSKRTKVKIDSVKMESDEDNSSKSKGGITTSASSTASATAIVESLKYDPVVGGEGSDASSFKHDDDEDDDDFVNVLSEPETLDEKN